MIVYRAVRIRAERIVTGEIDDIGGHRHDKGRGETTPKRSGPFVTCDLAEPVESGGEIAAACLIDRAVCCWR